MAMTIGGLIVAAILLVISIVTKTTWLQNFVFGGIVVWFALYFVMLFGSSLKSENKDLAIGEAKEFCGLYFDCHMHTAVTEIRRAKTIGNKTANGEFYVVKVKVFSNAKTATLGLPTVDAHVVDATGRTYDRDIVAESSLQPQPDFEKKISPAESFEKEIVFDLPENIQNPRLDIREGFGIEQVLETVLIGDEDSLLHKRIYFKLEGQSQTAAIR